MGFDREITAAASEQLTQRKQLAEHRAAQAQEAFYDQCPRAREIRQELASNASGIAKAVLQGGDVRTALEELHQRALALEAEYDNLLAQHGLSRAQLAPQYTCPLCKDTGIYEGKMCDCLKQLQRAMAYRKLSMAVPLEKCTFETFSLEYYQDDPKAAAQMKNILRVCRDYADHFKPGAANWLFKGGTGLGKTHLSLAIAGEVLEKGYGVIYASAQTLAVALERERFLRGDETAESTHEKLIACDLLILDDLGTEVSSDYVNASLYDVINQRMLAQKPTIISTNLTMSQLEDRYSQRFASRVAGTYNKLEFLGSDVRIAIRRKKQKR